MNLLVILLVLAVIVAALAYFAGGNIAIAFLLVAGVILAIALAARGGRFGV